MELLERTRALAAALATADLEGLLDPDAVIDVPPPGHYEILDAVPKRNLVFASWRRDDGATGTWVLSWDREGHVTHWTEM